MKWENNILGFVPKTDWLDIPFNPNRPSDPVDALFGDEKTDNLVARWQSIASEYQIPVMAQFDVQSNTTVRVPVDTHNIEKGLIKVKINQSERLRALLRAGVQQDQLYDYVINDGVNLAEQVLTRTKVAKNELMATGKVTIKENGLDLTVDYGVPEAQTQYTLDLSPNADIMGQLQAIIDDALARGAVITGLMTSKKNIAKMRKNIGLQTAINGNAAIGSYVRSASLEAFLSDEFGITQIITNDLTYASSRTLADGQISQTTERYFPTDKVTFFANVGGKLGTGLWGDAPEVDLSKLMNVSGSSVSPFVAISQWSENDPAVLWTKASALFMPVLYNPNGLFIATVTDDDSLPDIKVTPVPQSGTQYGVSVANIQSADTAILANKEMTGKSKWMATGNNITNYWGAGNFLAVNFTVPNDDWTRYTSVLVGLEPSAGSGFAQLIGEDDKSATFKVADPKNQKLVILASDGVHTDRQEISLKGVTLESAGA